MKKILTLVLVLCLTVVSFGIVATAESEKPTFTVWVKSDAEDVSLFPEIAAISEATGIYPDFIEISPATWEERMSLMWAGNDYPDVITGDLAKINDVNTYYPYGVITPIDDLIPLMPNFQKYMDCEEGAWDLIKSADGNMYYFPTITQNYIGAGLYINQEWLDELNLQIPNTPEELYEVLCEFRDGDPNGNGIADEIPFTGEMLWTDGMDTLAYLFGAFGMTPEFQIIDDKVVYGAVEESAKEAAKFLRQLYTEGLIDQEFFTQDLTSVRSKMQSETPIVGMMIPFVAAATNRCLTTERWMSGMYSYMLPLENEDGVRLFPGYQPLSANCQLIITSACQCPETVAEWVDYMYDPVVSLEIDQAPIGIAWEVTENNEFILKKEGPEGYGSVNEWRLANHLQQLPRMMSRKQLQLRGISVPDVPGTTSEDYHTRDKYYIENGVVCATPLPSVPPTEEETNTLNMYLTDITKYYKETFSNWITGNGDIDKEWDAYIQNVQNAGLQAVLDVYQAQYDRYIGK